MTLAVLIKLSLLLPALLSYNTLCEQLVAQYEQNHPCDPATGAQPVCAPLTLGPEDAPVAVLFIHGFNGGVPNFGDLPVHLAAQGCRVRVMRLPGHGSTPHAFENATLDDLIDAVHTEYETLDTKHGAVVLVGESMGGALATWAAAEGEPDGLILMAPYFGMAQQTAAPETVQRSATLILPWIRWVYAHMPAPVNDPEGAQRGFAYPWLPTRTVLNLGPLAARVNRPEVLEAVRCPVLLLQSRNDRVVSPKAAERAVNAMTNAAAAETLWLERSNHVLGLDYERALIAEKMAAFIKGIG